MVDVNDRRCQWLMRDEISVLLHYIPDRCSPQLGGLLICYTVILGVACCSHLSPYGGFRWGAPDYELHPHVSKNQTIMPNFQKSARWYIVCCCGWAVAKNAVALIVRGCSHSTGSQSLYLNSHEQCLDSWKQRWLWDNIATWINRQVELSFVP